MSSLPKAFHEIFPDPPADLDISAFNSAHVPRHIAAIMDGNGRWAKQRGLSRAAGHKAGVEGVREVIRASNDMGVSYLTIYSFSTENWNRPLSEVRMLMTLFAETMAAELSSLEEEHVRIKLIGRIDDLPTKTRETFERAIERTADNDGMTLIMAVNYGARQEIADAIRSIASEVAAGVLIPESIDESTVESHLDTAAFPDPDLLIRTSGEYRLSNFLLYQIAYSEFYITDVLWPDFDRYELLRAVLNYQVRERRFGGI